MAQKPAVGVWFPLQARFLEPDIHANFVSIVPVRKVPSIGDALFD